MRSAAHCGFVGQSVMLRSHEVSTTVYPRSADPQIGIGKLELTITVERSGPAGVNRPSQPAISVS